MTPKKQKEPTATDIALATIAGEQRNRLRILSTHARAAIRKAEDLREFMNAKLAHREDYGKILEPEFLRRASQLADAATQAHELAFVIKAGQHTSEHIRKNADTGRKA
jgi:hypothetical protein